AHVQQLGRQRTSSSLGDSARPAHSTALVRTHPATSVHPTNVQEQSARPAEWKATLVQQSGKQRTSSTFQQQRPTASRSSKELKQHTFLIWLEVVHGDSLEYVPAASCSTVERRMKVQWSRSKQERGSPHTQRRKLIVYLTMGMIFFVFFLFKMKHIESGLQPSLNWIKVENPSFIIGTVQYGRNTLRKEKKVKYGRNQKGDKRGESRGVGRSFRV
ncbi:hypothetical protein VIGAN_UM017100, partial [Vigna angularis var. angularis]